MRWILVILTLMMLARPGVGQQLLTLRSAMDNALSGSPAVQAALEAAEAAGARSERARGFRLPSVDLSEVYTGTDNPAAAFALQLNQKRFDGMQFFQSDPNNPDWLNNWLTRLEVVQPVYTGGKLSARIEQASFMSTASELELTHAREQVGHDTVMAFTNLAKAREYHRLLEEARNTTAEHVKLAEQYAAQGLIVNAEVLKAMVYLAEMDELLAVANNGARLAEAALNFNMGVDQTVRHRLAPLPAPPVVAGELSSWIVVALDSRRDLNAARRKLDASRLEDKVARSPFLPELAVIGQYDLYDDVPFGAHGDSATVVAVAKINLYRGGADRAQRVAARHETASFEHRIRRFEEGVRLEVQEAWHDLETARVRHGTARTSLEAAREALRVREHRFRQGLDRMIDLLDAETALRESEVRELTARYDVALATFRLYFASGTSLIELVEENS